MLLLYSCQLAGLVLLTSAVQRDASRERFPNTVFVLLSETLKFAVSLAALLLLAARTHMAAHDGGEGKRWLPGAPRWQVLVPASIYVLQNNLMFYGMSNLSPTTYLVLSRFRTLFTGLISHFGFGKRLTASRWTALVLQIIGSVLTRLRFDAKAVAIVEHTQNEQLGMLATLTNCILSSVAAVLLESQLKMERPGFLSKSSSTYTLLWTNMEMALLSMPLAALACYWNEQSAQPLLTMAANIRRMDAVVLAVVVMQALAGLLAALTLQTADAVVKTFATSLSLILACLVSWILSFEQTLSPTLQRAYFSWCFHLCYMALACRPLIGCAPSRSQVAKLPVAALRCSRYANAGLHGALVPALMLNVKHC